MSKKYVVKEDIVIKAGTELERGPDNTKYYTPHYGFTIAYGNDHSARLTIDEGTLKALPEHFERA